MHEFFDELRVEGSKLPNGKDLPELFNFTKEGESLFPHPEPAATPMLTHIELSTRPDLIRQLVPAHAEPALRARGIDIDNFEPIPLEQLRITLDVGLDLGRAQDMGYRH